MRIFTCGASETYHAEKSQDFLTGKGIKGSMRKIVGLDNLDIRFK